MALKESNHSIVSVSAGARRPRANTIGDPQPSRSMDNKSPMARDSCSSGSFVTKLYKMVDSEPATIVSWIRGGTAFCIVDPKMMAEHCLPKYFRHRRFSSLIRQLNFYSFYRVQEGQLTIYQHSFFRKGRPDLLVHIKRRGAGKAKDPWFDPLAPPSKPPMPMPMNHLVVNSSLDSGFADGVMGHSSNSICYSPMAKPLASSIDNMSPALKPGVAHMSPPVVDLGGNAIISGDKFLESHRWGSQQIDLQQQKEFGPVIVKGEEVYGDISCAPIHQIVMKPTMPASGNLMDIDIQDFLTEDCSINAGSAEKIATEDRGNTKRALVARNCLKWNTKDESRSFSDRCGGDTESHTDEDATFEQELLLDLANVEPGAWEVPLSPLNEEEDVMPWLDLCF